MQYLCCITLLHFLEYWTFTSMILHKIQVWKISNIDASIKPLGIYHLYSTVNQYFPHSLHILSFLPHPDLPVCSAILKRYLTCHLSFIKFSLHLYKVWDIILYSYDASITWNQILSNSLVYPISLRRILTWLRINASQTEELSGWLLYSQWLAALSTNCSSKKQFLGLNEGI